MCTRHPLLNSYTLLLLAKTLLLCQSHFGKLYHQHLRIWLASYVYHSRTVGHLADQRTLFTDHLPILGWFIWFKSFNECRWCLGRVSLGVTLQDMTS